MQTSYAPAPGDVMRDRGDHAAKLARLSLYQEQHEGRTVTMDDLDAHERELMMFFHEVVCEEAAPPPWLRRLQPEWGPLAQISPRDLRILAASECGCGYCNSLRDESLELYGGQA